jgi:hypothetical protein
VKNDQVVSAVVVGADKAVMAAVSVGAIIKIAFNLNMFEPNGRCQPFGSIYFSTW